MVTETFLTLIPSIGAQAKHVVVGKACATKRPRKHCGLLWRRVKPKSVCTFNVHCLHDIIQLCEMRVGRQLAVAVYFFSTPKFGVSEGRIE